ncbi:MAG: sirohydrochlorin cobaltochelatase [Desulfovibrio sp.]|nr:sirohydrochlorin cobaltochelatase [Desulfovibrio sp.]
MSRPHRLLPHFFLSLLLLVSLAACAQKNTAVGSAGSAEGVLLVAFGTSVPEALPSMEAVDVAFKDAFPGQPVVWAYTSQRIRKKLAAEGRPVGGISDGLERLAGKGVRTVRVQSLHVMAGEEFSALERALLLDVKAHPGRFDHVYLGRPMLESAEDARALARAVREDTAPLRKNGSALVLMGHGQEHGRAGLTFEGTRAVFSESDRRTYMATVEGARGFDELLAELRKDRVRRVVLQPLMLVAGDHARNDLAGAEDDSWASRLTKAGISNTAHLKGLGQIEGVRALLVRHAKESADDITREPRKQ